jgi:hypothetical protein
MRTSGKPDQLKKSVSNWQGIWEAYLDGELAL